MDASTRAHVSSRNEGSRDWLFDGQGFDSRSGCGTTTKSRVGWARIGAFALDISTRTAERLAVPLTTPTGMWTTAGGMQIAN